VVLSGGGNWKPNQQCDSCSAGYAFEAFARLWKVSARKPEAQRQGQNDDACSGCLTTNQANLRYYTLPMITTRMCSCSRRQVGTV